MDIVPKYEGTNLSDLPVVTITVLDSEDGPKTITVYGAIYVEAYAPGKHDDGPAAATAHLREQAGDWKAFAPRGSVPSIVSRETPSRPVNITRVRDTESNEIIEFDIDTVDAQLEMEVRAKRAGSLLCALARYILNGMTIPSWLAQAVCSPWGRSVMANTIEQAEAALNPLKRG